MPSGTPAFIVITGMSGSGKTTLAAALEGVIPNAVHLDADRTRKEMLGVAPTTRLPPEAYSPAVTQKLIEEQERRIRRYLAEGKTVILSAAILRPEDRQRQERLAQECAAALVGIYLQADLNVLFERVARRVNDASDAGVEIVRLQAAAGHGPGDWQVIDAAQSPPEMLAAALRIVAAAPGAGISGIKSRPPAV